MKNIIGAALLLLPTLIACTACEGQDIASEKVPQPVKTAFTLKFPKAEHAKWEMEDKKDYEANFKEAGAERSATFDAQGKWLETETEIEQTDLPTAVNATLVGTYAGQKLKEFARVETLDRGTLYEVEMEKGETTSEVQFDAAGKVLGAKVEDEDGKDEKDKD